MDSADELLVVEGIVLDLVGVLAEPLRPAWLDIPEDGDLRYLPDPLPDTVGCLDTVGAASIGVADVSELCVAMTPSPPDPLLAGLWAPPDLRLFDFFSKSALSP